jgi:predicted transcriptional regulator
LKNSITLSPETLRAVDELARPPANRSQVFEQAVVDFLDRKRQGTRDIAILNRVADELNAEVEDILAYQEVP